MISTFDLFKIGIGPSSSHTVGPMVAARRFREAVLERGQGERAVTRLVAEIYGSLAWTGRGHATDVAILLGLLGHEPASIDPDRTTLLAEALRRTGDLGIPGIVFDVERDLVFNFTDILPLHTNGMRFRAFDAEDGMLEERIFYSVGGGFVIADTEADSVSAPAAAPPFAFGSARDLLDLTLRTGLTIPQIQLANELSLRSREAIEAGLDGIRDAMFACIERGLRMEGELPGGLRVRRRAKRLHDSLEATRLTNSRPAHEIMDWISLFALAVNEENASGGRVVTAPTNGAAGIVPSVLRYSRDFCPGWSDERGRDFLLTAAAIGGIIKHYEYCMIPYILAENPKISRKDAFYLSKQLTNRNKWKLFLLDLSFLGWHVL